MGKVSNRPGRRYGMPRQMQRKLSEWFNVSPYPDVKTYFLWKGKKVWYYSFLEENNYELHMRYKWRMAGHIWFQPEKDGTATIIGIHIQEKYRNCNLGTVAFEEAISQIKDKISILKGLLEKEVYPEPEDSLRWLHRQGFTTKQNANGDYELELRIK